MDETLENIFGDVEQRMAASIADLKKKLSGLRAGSASSSMFENISINAYGSHMPLNQVASVTVSDAKTVLIQPWDGKVVDDIVDAIMSSNLGLNPIKDGGKIRVPIPELSEERRIEISKAVGSYGEAAKNAIRNIRRDGMKRVDTLEKGKSISKDDKASAEKKVQDITDKYISNIDASVKSKKESIMKV